MCDPDYDLLIKQHKENYEHYRMTRATDDSLKFKGLPKEEESEDRSDTDSVDQSH